MLFNFSLTPLERVKPWGDPDNQTLHWFGLTDGQYWIAVGNDTLLEYSDHLWARNDWPRYCDYQVARIYEDLLDMLPFVLEPVPIDLISYLSGNSGASWDAKSASWFSQTQRPNDDDRYWEIVDSSATWIGRRTLDSLYLSPRANIRLWSDEDHVHIDWDHSKTLLDGNPVWSALRGSFQIPRSNFLREIHSFHERLMTQMSSRVESVLSGVFPTNVKIDFQALQQEQTIRSRSIENSLSGRIQPTDWNAVRSAISEIECGTYLDQTPQSKSPRTTS